LGDEDVGSQDTEPGVFFASPAAAQAAHAAPPAPAEAVRLSSVFVDALVRDAALEARRRAVDVTIRDEGGLEGCDFVDLETIRFEVASVINRTKSGRVVVRAPKGEKWRLSVVVSQPGSDAPDEFLKLGARP
jgi:hypothetical protein